jgi:hypothetical protein
MSIDESSAGAQHRSMAGYTPALCRYETFVKYERGFVHVAEMRS